MLELVASKETAAGNVISVLELPDEAPPPLGGARILSLDATGNIHSLVPAGRAPLSGAYWDYFAVVAPLVAEVDGKVGLLGLGAGTAARALQHAAPDAPLVGWELDGELLAVAREHLFLAELEDNGLDARQGDALDAALLGEAAPLSGLVVDLFAGGRLLPQMLEAETWERWLGLLSPGGRVVANLGGGSGAGLDDQEKDAALAALRTALGGEQVATLCLRDVPGSPASNTLALSGPLPDVAAWQEGLPEDLRPLAAAGWDGAS